MKREVTNRYTSIDIGSSEIKMVTATYEEGEVFKINELASVTSTGVSYGEITNIENFYQDIDKLTKPYRKSINNIVVNISSSKIQSRVVKNGISIRGRVDEQDIENVIKDCKDYASSEEKGMNNFFYVKNFILNHSKNTITPVGEKAKYLEVNYNLVSLDGSVKRTIDNVFGKLNLFVLDSIPSAVALGKFALTSEQKIKGVCLLDIGKHTTDVIIYKNNYIEYLETIDFGGDSIDENIAYHYDCTLDEAQRLKENYGCININTIEQEQCISFMQENSEKFLSNYQLAEVIEQSVKQLLNNVKSILKNNEITNLNSGFVITGGGANIKQFVEFARVILKNKVNYLRFDESSVNAKISINNAEKLTKHQVSLALLTYNKDTFYKEQQFQHNKSFINSLKQKLSILEK